MSDRRHTAAARRADEMFDARGTWPHLTAALARYTYGPVITDDDRADASETIGDYQVWRATITDAGDPTFVLLRQVIRKAFAERHRWAS